MIESIFKKPFDFFQPVPYDHTKFGKTHLAYVLRGDKGEGGQYLFHNPLDAINEHRSLDDACLIEYQMNTQSHDIFQVKDFSRVSHDWTSVQETAVQGTLAERIAWRTTKFYFKYVHSQSHKGGKMGQLYFGNFDPEKSNGFTVKNSDNYQLKILKYPNHIILHDTKDMNKGKFGFEQLAELDGLFHYRWRGKSHIIVLEAKVGALQINEQHVVNDVFSPLRVLFPGASFGYVLFASRNSIYRGGENNAAREMRSRPKQIHDALSAEGINTLFFSFNEKRKDFTKMQKHLVSQYRYLHEMLIPITGTMSKDRIVLRDEGETPVKVLRLKKNKNWKEV